MLGSLGLALALSITQPVSENGRIAGRVVTDDGANTPIAGARVTLMFAGRPPVGRIGPPPQAITDNAGQFAFDAVAPGGYRVDAQRAGFAPPNQDFAPRAALQVEAGKTLNVEIRLKKGAAITGRLLDESGAPLADVRVTAMRRVPGPASGPPRLAQVPMMGQGPQQTNDIGEFRISGLAPGEYYIAAMRTPSGMFGAQAAAPAANGPAPVTTYYPGTTDPAAAQPILVTEGDSKGNVEFRMLSLPSFRVTGRVVDEQNQPVAGAMVMLTGDPRNGVFGGPIGSARTGDNGRFTISQVPAGTYQIAASIPVQLNGATGASWTSASGSGVAAGVTSTVVGGGVVTQYVGGRQQQSLEVVVSDADVSGVQVVVKRQP